MGNNFKDRSFKQLLDKLQQESWQLELIISGFAIFGLFTAFPQIKIALEIAKNDKHIYAFVILLVALIACYILIFNLLVHVILRGLWIGALGLRYVSGDIEFDELNYQNKFTNYLKKKIVSFDRYVATLENYCSVLFAVSFLLIFYVISFTIIIIILVLIATYILSNDDLSESIRFPIGVTLVCFIAFGSIFTFIDFATQGYLKKNKWLAKIYFPFYWVFSFLTLSFLYRPLVYNFLDNRFTKRLSFFLVPIYIVISVFNSVKYQKSNYLDSAKLNSKLYLDNAEYEDSRIKENDFVRTASIQSKAITDSYIKFFKVFNENVEDRIYNYNPSLKPKEDNRGFKTGLQFSSGNKRISRKKRDSLAVKYIETVNKMYTIKIDTIKYKPEFLISRNKQNQIGFETYIPTNDLKEGKHMLRLFRKRIRKGDTVSVIDVTIPFWHFKK
ncbi:hypothetical protein WH52_05435 [Tenacibaculum holothuriorum]|uniref:Uncharacterized protein n=1 Tax=Tenacibaculum holothuriorum TaxID=1635173 RepID=A0A1Y2PCS0_9FLAO|nr:hypothetical protein [Tenacibaculum holothuriorum]OSY88225.1 hypothetical protein WH52_05435 [Tenacibaculum holothuriorum]